MRDLVTQDMEKAEVLNDHKAQGHLRNLKEQRSMGHDEIHPWVLRELAEEVFKLLSITFEKS